MDDKLIKKIIEITSNQLGVPREELSLEVDLIKDLNLQKVEIADLVLTIEHEFQITLPPEKIAEVNTLEDIVALVSDNLL